MPSPSRSWSPTTAPLLRAITPIVLLLLLAPCGDAAAAPASGVRLLMLGGGVQVVPPTASTAFCAGAFEIDTVANTCSYRIVVSALASGEVASHIRGGAAPGAVGAILHTLPAGKLKTGIWNYPETSEADLLGGQLYVSVESTAFPAGELRGQLCDMVCTLDADQVVPPVASTTRGFGAFQIDTDANILTYHIFYDPAFASGEFAAHIHLPAGIGSSQLGNPPLTLPGGPLKTGTWNYPEAHEEALITGHAYVLAHSVQFLGGEVRGQISPSLSILDPGQTLPPVTTPAVGYAMFSVDRFTNEFSYDLRMEDLTGTESFTVVHGPAPVGAAAPGIFTMPIGNRKLASETLTAAEVQHFYDCQLYIDAHTSTFGDGEIRGQLYPRPIPSPSAPQLIRGDCNRDGAYNIADPVRLLGFAFPSVVPPPALPCDDACDCNDDGTLNIADAVCMLSGLFGSPAVPPVGPHPDCGEDMTVDTLGCVTTAACP